MLKQFEVRATGSNGEIFRVVNSSSREFVLAFFYSLCFCNVYVQEVPMSTAKQPLYKLQATCLHHISLDILRVVIYHRDMKNTQTPTDCKCGAKYVTGLLSAVNGQMVDENNQFECFTCYNKRNAERLRAEQDSSEGWCL